MSEQIIEQTRKWIEEVVVGCNFCPFARRELRADTIRYVVDPSRKTKVLREALLAECAWLDQHSDTETTLVIVQALADFDDYLGFVEQADRLLARRGYEGVYQLASFHPDYRFADSEPDDAANYTNRSPYPMLHLLREATVEKALETYPEPEGIPERNVEFARAKGADYFAKLLGSAFL